MYGARGLRQPLELRVGGELVDAPRQPQPPPAARAIAPARSGSPACVASLVLAGSSASTPPPSPDGLEKVAEDKGIDAKEEEHAPRTPRSPTTAVKGVADARLSGGLAGVIGVGVDLVAGRRRLLGRAPPAHRTRTSPGTPATASPADG